MLAEHPNVFRVCVCVCVKLSLGVEQGCVRDVGDVMCSTGLERGCDLAVRTTSGLPSHHHTPSVSRALRTHTRSSHDPLSTINF